VIQYRLRNKKAKRNNPSPNNVSPTNVTKEYKMQLLHITQTLIASLLIYISWGHDEPIYNFAIAFGGVLLGHVLTEALNFIEENEE
jgi:hypothetical protein